jgi:hypothetical protein
MLLEDIVHLHVNDTELRRARKLSSHLLSLLHHLKLHSLCM